MSTMQTPMFPGSNPTPAGLTLPTYSHESALANQVDHGPVCSRFDCRKPVKLPPHLGGCNCPPKDESLAINKTPAQRNLEANETVARCLVALCEHFKLKLPDAQPVTAEMVVSPTGAVAPSGVPEIDAIRAKAKAVKDAAS